MSVTVWTAFNRENMIYFSKLYAYIQQIVNDIRVYEYANFFKRVPIMPITMATELCTF